MPLKLMYITNRPDVAAIAERNGVDRIFVDMEYIGKAERQGKMDTVQNHHTVEDVKRVRAAITDAELLVRVNPIHDATDEYCSSEDEINAVIDAGACPAQPSTVIDLSGDVPTVLRELRVFTFCSMAMAGGRPRIKSHSGLDIRPRNWRA